MTADQEQLLARHAALAERVAQLEIQIAAGFDRMEKLVRQEIRDIKDEQIRELKEANTRLADDQRRAWTKIAELEKQAWDRFGEIDKREYRRVGSESGQHRVVAAISIFASAAFGGFITWAVTWLTTPHH